MHVPITNISFACIAATRRANDYAFAVAAFAAARDIAWWTASHRSVRMNRTDRSSLTFTTHVAIARAELHVNISTHQSFALYIWQALANADCEHRAANKYAD